MESEVRPTIEANCVHVNSEQLLCDQVRMLFSDNHPKDFHKLLTDVATYIKDDERYAAKNEGKYFINSALHWDIWELTELLRDAIYESERQIEFPVWVEWVKRLAPHVFAGVLALRLCRAIAAFAF